MKNTTIDEYTKFLKDSSWYEHAGEGNVKELTYLTLGLTGESGEFADDIKKWVRSHGFEHNIKDLDMETKLKMILELGDVAWYLIRMCDVLNINLEVLLSVNTLKLYERLQSNWEGAIEDEVVWPFSDPFLSYDCVGNAWQILGGKPDVRVDKEV